MPLAMAGEGSKGKAKGREPIALFEKGKTKLVR